MKKKGLVVVYDPHNLYQFVWYYCNRGKNKEWDALCLPNGYKGEYMHIFCERTEIFLKVFRNNTDFFELSNIHKIKMILHMLGYFLIGKRAVFCQKLINQYVNLDEYDELVVIADVGVVSGACVALGEEKEVIILEDGRNDYGRRPRFLSKTDIMSSYAWQGFLLSLMGYCSPGWFRLRTDKYCVKYCSQPEKMIYREYREIRILYAKEGTDEILFNNLLRKMYPRLNEYDFDKFQTIIFTKALDDFCTDYEKYNKRFEKYISEKNFQSIMLKKHPRENQEYEFGNNTEICEIDNSIPAEALLPFLKDKEIIIVTTSAVMMYLKSYGLKCKVIIFKGMYEESLISNAKYSLLSMEETIDYCEDFTKGCYQLVEI